MVAPSIIDQTYGVFFLVLMFSISHSNLIICFFKVRYHMDEDPKTLKVFPIPLSGSHYDRLSLSPDGKILAATLGSTLQWLCVETGKVLDTADKVHEGMLEGQIFLFSIFPFCIPYWFLNIMSANFSLKISPNYLHHIYHGSCGLVMLLSFLFCRYIWTQFSNKNYLII